MPYKNIEDKLKHNKQYYQDNIKKILSQKRKYYYQNNKENILARIKKSNEENKRIKELYYEKGYTLEEIGNYFNLSPSAISYRMKKLGIKRRNNTEAAKNNTKDINKNKLRELYIDKKYSSRKCANYFAVSASIILKRLRKWRIPLRNRLEALKLKNTITGIDKDKLEKLYQEKKYSAKRCGEVFGCSKVSILRRLKQYNIPIRNRFECGKGEINWNWKGGEKEAQKRREGKLKYQLNKRMRIHILHSLKRGIKNKQHWEYLVGYTTKDLIKRLQKTMPEDYTWQDFMQGKLHIDHIIPINAFNFDKPEHIDFKRCWALSNLQLLPAKENLKKSNKLLRPFQPSLAL